MSRSGTLLEAGGETGTGSEALRGRVRAPWGRPWAGGDVLAAMGALTAGSQEEPAVSWSI